MYASHHVTKCNPVLQSRKFYWDISNATILGLSNKDKNSIVPNKSATFLFLRH